MLASELVKKINELIEKHGDLTVFNYDGSMILKNVDFFDECQGDCDCFLTENCNHCEAEHFIDGFAIEFY